MHIKEPSLEDAVTQLYGSSLVRFKNLKTAYSIFTPYKEVETDQILYFYLLKVSSHDLLSEGTVSLALKKFHPFLSPVQFLLIERDFEFTYYLVKSYNCLISLEEMIRVKKECQEVVEKEYLLKTVEFLISIYKTSKLQEFPELSPRTLGLDSEGKLKICDFSLYFKKHFEMRSLTENICNCLTPMIKVAMVRASSRFLPSQDQFEMIKQNYSENFARLIKTLVLDPMEDMEKEGVFNGRGKKQNVKKIEEALELFYKTADEDPNTTLNETFEEDMQGERPSGNSYQDYRNSDSLMSDLITNQSIKEPFLIKDEMKKSSRKKNIQIIAIFLMLLLILGGSVVFLKYYFNPVKCQVGTFKAKTSNQCLACSEGCLRCDSEEKSSCFSCTAKMYLVLNDQKQVKGSCETNCSSGYIIKSNLCIRNKMMTQQNVHLSFEWDSPIY